jgi:hypothetical protein
MRVPLTPDLAETASYSTQADHLACLHDLPTTYSEVALPLMAGSLPMSGETDTHTGDTQASPGGSHGTHSRGNGADGPADAMSAFDMAKASPVAAFGHRSTIDRRPPQRRTPGVTSMSNAAQPPDVKSTTVVDFTFLVTMFDNHAAREKHEALWTLADLAQRIQDTTALTKDNLPWLKLVRFGDLRTNKHSLRHNANVVTITGVEGDDDSGTLDIDEMVDTLAKVNVTAIVYTSPSHTTHAPRLRVLCPLSTEYPPHQRDLFMGRLNGLFDGIFADESWILSQSYYYGSVNGNPAHRVELIDGTPIDQHPELTWLGRSEERTGSRASGSGVGARATTVVTPLLDLGPRPQFMRHAGHHVMNADTRRSRYSRAEVMAAVASIPDGYPGHPLGAGRAWRMEFLFPLADYAARHPEHRATVRVLFRQHTRRIADPVLVSAYPGGADAYFAAAEKRFDAEVRNRSAPRTAL